MNVLIKKSALLLFVIPILMGCENKIQLTAPNNVRIENGQLRWDIGAFDTYPDFTIMINDNETKRVSYNLLLLGGSLPLDFITESGEYNFKLQTVTNNDVTNLVYKSSTITDVTFTITLLSKISFISYDLDTQSVSWNQISGALNYELIIDGVSFISQTNSYPLARKDVGGYSIKIKAKGNNGTLFDGEFSDVKSFFFLEKPSNIQRDNLQISWSNVTNASSYQIFNNLSQIGETTSTSYTLPNFITGNLSITIKGIGNNTSFFDSLMSDPLQFTIL